MELFKNFKELFLSVWDKGILGIDIFEILIGLGIFLIFLIFRLLSKTKFWEKLTLPTSQKSSEGYNTSIGLEGFVGKLGISTSDLRPSGWGEFDSKKLFIVTEGEFVDRKEKIEILSVDGNRILVRKISN